MKKSHASLAGPDNLGVVSPSSVSRSGRRSKRCGVVSRLLLTSLLSSLLATSSFRDVSAQSHSSQIRISSSGKGAAAQTVIRIPTTSKEKPQAFVVSNPLRIVVDIPGASVRKNSSLAGDKAKVISKVRVGAHSDKVRVVADVIGEIAPQYSLRTGNGYVELVLSKPGSKQEMASESSTSGETEDTGPKESKKTVRAEEAGDNASVKTPAAKSESATDESSPEAQTTPESVAKSAPSPAPTHAPSKSEAKEKATPAPALTAAPAASEIAEESAADEEVSAPEVGPTAHATATPTTKPVKKTPTAKPTATATPQKTKGIEKKPSPAPTASATDDAEASVDEVAPPDFENTETASPTPVPTKGKATPTPKATATEAPPTPEPTVTSAEVPILGRSVSRSPGEKTSSNTKSSSNTAQAAADVQSQVWTLREVVFDKLPPGKTPLLKLVLSRGHAQVQIAKIDPKTYRLILQNGKIGGQHLTLPQFPPADFEGFTVVAVKQVGSNVEVTIGVEPGTTLGTFVRQSEIWTKRL